MHGHWQTELQGYKRAPKDRRELQKVYESSRGRPRQGDLQRIVRRPRQPWGDGFWSATVFEHV